MSLVDNIGGVSFESQFPIDKIVGVWEGSFDRATDVEEVIGNLGSIFVYKIEHGFTRPVFVDLLWSDDNAAWADGGTAGSGGGVSIAYSDDTYIYIIGGLSSAGTGTRYYKAIAFWIDNYDDTNPLVNSFLAQENPINFDSRENYQKIYKQDVEEFSSSTTVSIIHDFDYKPNARLHFEAIEGEVWPVVAGGASNPFLYDGAMNEALLEIYDDKISIVMFKASSFNPKAWYRLYLDA